MDPELSANFGGEDDAPELIDFARHTGPLLERQLVDQLSPPRVRSNRVKTQGERSVS